jgi:VWFA-related protein
VPGLRREDFRIFDNGAEQPMTGFVPSEEPARLVLLIEDSTADYFLAKLGKSPFGGADGLLSKISDVDQVAVVTYSDAPRVLLDFTPDKNQARQVLQGSLAQALRARAAAGSGWQNLSFSVAATIDWVAGFPGSKIVLLISTGIDTSSPQSWELMQQKLKTSDVRILTLSMLGDFRKPAKHPKLTIDEREARSYVKEGMREFDGLLRELSTATGGRVYAPKNQREFDQAYAAVAQLVRGEYTLEFVPPAFDGHVHTLKVKVRGWGTHADYRPAYLAPLRLSP